MRKAGLLICMLLFLVPRVQAADSTLLFGNNLEIKTYFAVYEIKFPSNEQQKLEEAITNAVRHWFRDAQLTRGIPSSPQAPAPGKMLVVKQGSVQKGQCEGEWFAVEGEYTGMARYGEISQMKTCVYQYSKGYRVYFLANFGQRSGMGGGNSILGAMLGRSLVGDSSKFIPMTLERLETNVKEAGGEIILVEAYPVPEGKKVAGYSNDVPAPVENVQQQQVVSTVTPMPSLPPQLMAMMSPADRAKVEAQYQAALAQRQGMPMNGQPVASTATAPVSSVGEDAALKARKELHGMGLKYFDQDQFCEAIRRGDDLAVSLFLQGGGVDVNKADRTGKKPMELAMSAGDKGKNLADLLRQKGAK